MNIKKILNNLELDEYLLLGFIIFACLLQIMTFSQFKHLPGPIYGGDLYRERGFTQVILNGIPFYESPYTPGEFHFFPYLAYILIAGITKITGFSLDFVMIYFPLLITIFGIIGVYFAGKIFFKNKNAALIMAISSILFRPFYEKVTTGLAYLFLIWFLYFWFRYEETRKAKDGLFAGLFLGLVALSHGSVFIYGLAAFLGAIFLFFIYDAVKNPKDALKIIIEYIKRYYKLLGLAFVISMIFFGPIIIKYHLKMLNNSLSYTLIDVSKLGFGFVLKLLFNSFFDFSNNLFLTIIRLIAFFGFIISVLNFKRKESKTPLFIMVIITLSAMSFLITKPLFDKSIDPFHLFEGIWIPLVLFMGFGTIGLIKLSKDVIKRYYITSILLIIVVFGMIKVSINYNNDQWTEYGKNMDPQTASLYETGSWLMNNMDNAKTVLANDESSFMINAMAGKRVVFSRRVHASYYEDVDKKYADGVVMLFGNDSETDKKLLKEYNVEYVYVDQFLFSYPIVVNLKYKDYMDMNGINYTIRKVRLDPSTNDAPAFDSLVVSPNMNSVMLQALRNLSSENTLIAPAKSFYVSGQISSLILKVK